MSLKQGVLGLVVERRGYGYELVQRFTARVGPAWQLNPGAVYAALGQLERDGLVRAQPHDRAQRGNPRIVFAATPAGASAFDAWLASGARGPEPVRSELQLKLALSTPAHREVLAAEVDAHARACAELLASAPPVPAEVAGAPWAARAARMAAASTEAQLRARLAWLADVRAELGAGGDGG